ncbi:hypothetical protein T02_7444 [Trichinella nativa]|uniref:Uncharacterized protein n=1 Tax=Trichinella nativa TaxID=6335 RepID=A0A0V1L0L0_9BILA|nr:hypothetical protein T02_7444 [Trichinella nativa]
MFYFQKEYTSQYKEKYNARLRVEYIADLIDKSGFIHNNLCDCVCLQPLAGVLMFITVHRIASFQIRPLKCKPGYRVSSISRVMINGISSYDVECMPFSDNPERIKDITCSDGTVPTCNGTLGGCDQHPDSWIGGVKVVPYEEDSSVEILIPYCCNASNVLVHGDTCRHSRLSSLGRLLTLATKPDEIMQGLSCQVTRNHNGRIYDVTLKVRSCRFEIEQECCNKYMFGYFLHNFWNKEKTA